MDVDLWQRHNDRPAFVREHRDDLAEHLSDTVAAKLPDPDASLFEYRQFINTHKGTVTRQLRDDDG